MPHHPMPHHYLSAFRPRCLSQNKTAPSEAVLLELLAGLSGTNFSPAMFIAGAVTNAIPGIILHIILIPLLVMSFERTGLMLNTKKTGR
jgi:hypothetical protein